MSFELHKPKCIPRKARLQGAIKYLNTTTNHNVSSIQRTSHALCIRARLSVETQILPVYDDNYYTRAYHCTASYRYIKQREGKGSRAVPAREQLESVRCDTLSTTRQLCSIVRVCQVFVHFCLHSHGQCVSVYRHTLRVLLPATVTPLLRSRAEVSNFAHGLLTQI